MAFSTNTILAWATSEELKFSPKVQKENTMRKGNPRKIFLSNAWIIRPLNPWLSIIFRYLLPLWDKGGIKE
jgi:hypothetical protein